MEYTLMSRNKLFLTALGLLVVLFVGAWVHGTLVLTGG